MFYKYLLFIFIAAVFNNFIYSSEFPQTRFIVFSDPHLYSKTLGISGKAFERHIEFNRKLLAESEEILDQAINEILKEKADFIIIAGDLTKDGEKINHEILAEKLKRFTKKGIKVILINGNHDVKNGVSEKYNGNRKIRIENVSAADFKNIYSDFGYKNAAEKDDSSLSYVSEPISGLWILMIDSNDWINNSENHRQNHHGLINEKTLKWIEIVLKKAKDSDKKVIAVMHHGILEHYKNNAKFLSAYIIKDHKKISRFFLEKEVNIFFTGHFHSQDITSTQNTGKKLFDIETGSLISYPSPYRIITLSKNQKMKIESKYVNSIPSHTKDFETFSRNSLFSGISSIVKSQFPFFLLSKNDKKELSEIFASSLLAHVKGDEKSPKIILNKGKIDILENIILFFTKDLIIGWKNDLSPSDNELTINLKTFEVEK